MLTLERDDRRFCRACFAWRSPRPTSRNRRFKSSKGPYALIGRTAGCTCRFDHPEVERRHAYLRSFYGRLYCIDLDSAVEPSGRHAAARRMVRSRRRDSHWPVSNPPGRHVGTGHRQQALSSNFNPLDRYAGDVGPLPKIVLTVRGAGRHAHYTISRPITLVGTATACKLRLTDNSVSSIHCSLLWLRDGLWIIDLAGKGEQRFKASPSAVRNSSKEIGYGSASFRCGSITQASCTPRCPAGNAKSGRSKSARRSTCRSNVPASTPSGP